MDCCSLPYLSEKTKFYFFAAISISKGWFIFNVGGRGEGRGINTQPKLMGFFFLFLSNYWTQVQVKTSISQIS